MPRQDLQQQRRVPHRAGQRSALGKDVRGRRGRGAAVKRHPPLRGLDAVYPAEVGRNADRAATVAAGSQRAQVRGQRRRRPGTGPARSVIGVPGVATVGAEQVLARAHEAQLGCVCLAQDDGARRPYALHDRVVPLRNAVLEPHRAAGRADAAGHLRVLDRDRQPVQRAERLTPLHGLLGGPGLLSRQVRGEQQKRVQPPIEPLDAVQEELDVTSTGETCRAAIRRSSSVADEHSRAPSIRMSRSPRAVRALYQLGPPRLLSRLRAR